MSDEEIYGITDKRESARVIPAAGEQLRIERRARPLEECRIDVRW